MFRRLTLAATSALAFSGACAGDEPPGPVVVGAAERSVLPQSELIEGRDGGYSTLLWDRSVWLFGDTVLRTPDVDDQTWHHNSVSFTVDLDASDGIDAFVEPLDEAGAPAHAIEPTADERAFNLDHAGDDCRVKPCGARWATWPGAAVYDPDRDRALVFYGLIYGEPGELNFEGRGQSIAVWPSLDAPIERPVIDPGADHPTMLFDADGPNVGVGAAVDGDRLYTFSCERDGLAHQCSLLRVQLARALDKAAWQAWDGDAWTGSLSDREVLFEGAPIMSLGFAEGLDAWLLIYSAPFDPQIVARTAPALTGPWSAPSVIYEVPKGEDPPYDALHHPELQQDGGRIQYVTYSRRTTGWFGAEFPMIRVTLQ